MDLMLLLAGSNVTLRAPLLIAQSVPLCSVMLMAAGDRDSTIPSATAAAQPTFAARTFRRPNFRSDHTIHCFLAPLGTISNAIGPAIIVV
jgi:hypothetical protein